MWKCAGTSQCEMAEDLILKIALTQQERLLVGWGSSCPLQIQTIPSLCVEEQIAHNIANLKNNFFRQSTVCYGRTIRFSLNFISCAHIGPSWNDGFGFGFRLHSLVWSHSSERVRKSMCSCQTSCRAKLDWAESGANAVIFEKRATDTCHLWLLVILSICDLLVYLM